MVFVIKKLRYRGWYHIIIDIFVTLVIGLAYFWGVGVELSHFLAFIFGNIFFVIESQFNLSHYYKALTMDATLTDKHGVVTGLQGAENIGLVLILPFAFVRFRATRRLKMREMYPTTSL